MRFNFRCVALRASYSRSKIKIKKKVLFYFVFCSLIRNFVPTN